MSLLVAENIVSGYGETIILKGVSVRLERGEIISIIGPNGAGKSTLIKTIFGLLRPVEGQIRFRSWEIAGMAPEQLVRLGISYVPQLENTFSSLTVEENLEMGFYIIDYGFAGLLKQLLLLLPGQFKGNAYVRLMSLLSRISDNEASSTKLRALHDRLYILTKEYADAESRFYDGLARVFEIFPDLKSRMKTTTKNLSGGQQQMVALARALMLDPEVLLIDEPSAGLAPNLVDSIFSKIREINEAGTSIILVEQNAKKALQMAARGYVLDMGTNRYEDTGIGLLNNPEVGQLYLGG